MTSPRATVKLKQGRERSVNNRHPWIYSGSVEQISDPAPQPGDIVDILDNSDHWLARAYFNPNSQIHARILTWDNNDNIDDSFWARQLDRSISMRNALQLGSETNAYRLVFAESDCLPGLIVDKYADYLVIQCLTVGIERQKEIIVDQLQALLYPKGIVERSDASVRKKEGLNKVVGIRSGTGPPPELEVWENGLRFIVDLFRGHKTGMYLDQRDNRAAVCDSRNVKGKRILNVFSYTGGFGVYAARASASQITHIEASSPILNQAFKNITANGYERPNDQYLNGDAFQIMRDLRDQDELFDVVIVDPPKFAHSQKDVKGACRGYKDLNLLALQLLKSQGLLATFSCSGLVNRDLFQKVVFGAAIDAGRDVQIIQPLSQAADHPILLSFPESEYLKGFLCRILS